MRLTSKGRYGVRAVADLAALNGERPTSVAAIAAEEWISPEFLEQLFCRLRRSGIISSVRGPGGGFTLTRKPGEVSVKDILDAVGEPTAPPPGPESNSTEAGRNASRAWLRLSRIVDEFLSRVTLKEILEEAGDRRSLGPKPAEAFSCRFRKA